MPFRKQTDLCISTRWKIQVTSWWRKKKSGYKTIVVYRSSFLKEKKKRKKHKTLERHISMLFRVSRAQEYGDYKLSSFALSETSPELVGKHRYSHFDRIYYNLKIKASLLISHLDFPKRKTVPIKWVLKRLWQNVCHHGLKSTRK